MTELVYALVQAVHNLGAVAVVACPVLALASRGNREAGDRRLAWILLTAWGLQAVSGGGFAAASYGLKGALPEVTGVALAALAVKIAATAAGFTLGVALLRARRLTGGRPRAAAWGLALGLALSALTAAAPLRWYL
jgi:hypothetical protein